MMMVMILMTRKKPAASSFVGVARTPSRPTVSSSPSAMPPTPSAVADDHVHPAAVLPQVQVKDEDTVPVPLRAVTPEDAVSFSQDNRMDTFFDEEKKMELFGGKSILVLQPMDQKSIEMYKHTPLLIK